MTIPISFTRRSRIAAHVEKDEMLGLFVSMLDVQLRSIEAHVGTEAFSQAILEEVKKGLANLTLQAAGTGASELSNAEPWTEAYRLERLLAVIEPQETLRIELKRRVAEGINAGLPSIRRLKSDADTVMMEGYDSSKQPPVLKPEGIEPVRRTLISILEAIHWNDYAEPIQRAAIQRLVSIGLLALILVITPYLAIYFLIWSNMGLNLQSWVWLPIYTVITSGLFGASFSRLTYILKNANKLPLREFQHGTSSSALLLRGSVGVGGALVVFFS
jgi:hypothetical protein